MRRASLTVSRCLIRRHGARSGGLTGSPSGAYRLGYPCGPMRRRSTRCDRRMLRALRPERRTQRHACAGGHPPLTIAPTRRRDAMSVEDKLAINELLALYSHTLDNGDDEGWVQLFTEDAVWEAFPKGADKANIR